MKVNIKLLYLLFAFCILFQTVNNSIYSGPQTETKIYYPESYLGIDQLTFTHFEYFMNAYYYYDPVAYKTSGPGPNLYDYRNGIIYYSFSKVIYYG